MTGATPIDLCITPIDGRNYHKVKILSDYFSERALNTQRLFVEIQYLLWLSKYKIIRPCTKKEQSLLSSFSRITSEDYTRISSIEKKTNHDVQAIEIFLQEKLKKTTLSDIAPMVHFGLTSDDINSCAYALSINQALKKVVMPSLLNIHRELQKQSHTYRKIPLLARTHGQPANGTTYGKELGVFTRRLHNRIKKLSILKAAGKLSGNVGNFNAHSTLFPEINWFQFSETFLANLDLQGEPLTTQIAPYDTYVDIFQTLLQCNLLLSGLCKDLWIYALLGLLTQKRIEIEVGSTALPHKINPIYLEGAEGGFEIANALLEMYVRKLSYSRLQRDLSDSTIRRSIGTAFAYCLLSYQSVLEGIHRLAPNKEKMHNELEHHAEILSEAIQNYLRIKGFDDAYDQTKQFFRGNLCTQNDIRIFIDSLAITQKDKIFLHALTPDRYRGLAEKLVDRYV